MKYPGIYLPPGQKNYMITYSVNGKRFRESSHSDDPEEACVIKHFQLENGTIWSFDFCFAHSFIEMTSFRDRACHGVLSGITYPERETVNKKSMKSPKSDES